MTADEHPPEGTHGPPRWAWGDGGLRARLLGAIGSLRPPGRRLLSGILASPGFAGVVTEDELGHLAAALGEGRDETLRLLVGVAASYAFPAISGYAAGAVALGATSGAAYFGANLEFPATSLGNTVHAEQSAVTNAWMHGEEGLVVLALSAAPCGHCRQFLWELCSAAELLVLTPGRGPIPLHRLLPHAFGPADLGVTAHLMAPLDESLRRTGRAPDPVVAAAADAAAGSYAPYSKGLAGVALRTTGGTVLQGRCTENAAFNPSLSPMQAAVAQWRLQRGGAVPLERAVLVHRPSAAGQVVPCREVLSAVSPVPLEVHTAGGGEP